MSFKFYERVLSSKDTAENLTILYSSFTIVKQAHLLYKKNTQLMEVMQYEDGFQKFSLKLLTSECGMPYWFCTV